LKKQTVFSFEGVNFRLEEVVSENSGFKDSNKTLDCTLDPACVVTHETRMRTQFKNFSGRNQVSR